MKKLFLFLSLLCLPLMAMAGPLSSAAETVEGWFNDAGQCECPTCPTVSKGVVCPDTEIKDIQRPPFEVEAILDFYSAPTGGSPQFAAENYTFRGKHNFSSVLNVYGSYSTSSLDKRDYEGSLYDTNWQYQTIMMGVGWYVHPVIEIFGGVGKVMAKNSEGSEELGMAIEYGIKAHYALNQLGYKVVAGLLTREVPLAEEDAHIIRSQAEASATQIYIGVSLPIGY